MITKLLILFLCFMQMNSKHEITEYSITFGSCNGFFSDRYTSIFETIANKNSDLFIWIGDVVYIDYWIPPLELFYFYNDPTYIQSLFNNFKYNNPHYKKL